MVSGGTMGQEELVRVMFGTFLEKKFAFGRILMVELRNTVFEV